jgi:hypothetical protein
LIVTLARQRVNPIGFVFLSASSIQLSKLSIKSSKDREQGADGQSAFCGVSVFSGIIKSVSSVWFSHRRMPSLMRYAPRLPGVSRTSSRASVHRDRSLRSDMSGQA